MDFLETGKKIGFEFAFFYLLLFFVEILTSKKFFPMKMKGRLILVLLAFFVCLFTLSNGISQFNFGTTFNIFSTEYLVFFFFF